MFEFSALQLESSTKYRLERDLKKLGTLVFDLMETVVFPRRLNSQCGTGKRADVDLCTSRRPKSDVSIFACDVFQTLISDGQ